MANSIFIQPGGISASGGVITFPAATSVRIPSSLALGPDSVAGSVNFLDIEGPGGGVGMGISIQNTGVAAGDDVQIVFQTIGSRTITMGLDRSTAQFTISPGLPPLGGAGSVTIDALSGAFAVPVGDVSTPSISFAGSPTTGFLSQASGATVGTTVQSVLSFSVQNNGVYIPRDGYPLSFGLLNDVQLIRNAANTLALLNGTGVIQTFQIGQGNAGLAAGRVKMGRDAGAAVAPGAGFGLLRWEAGTIATSLKLVAYSGTSTTGVTVVDNVGTGN